MVGDSERFLEDNLVQHRDVMHWAAPAVTALVLAALSFFAYGEYFARPVSTFGQTLGNTITNSEAAR